MPTTHLTQQWYEKLLEELRKLKEEQLPEILERLKEAIAQWDISENAEYDTAMSERELAERRIAEITQILDDVEIIEHQKGGDIKYGSTITLEDEKGKTFELTLVGTGEVDVLEGTISFNSPLGAALRGKKKGDTVSVNAPQRKLKMKIVDVA